MPSAQPRQPIPLDQLRRKSQEGAASVRPDEYSLRTWIAIAQNSFKAAEGLWQEGRRTGNERKVEEAFLEYKKAARAFSAATQHSSFAEVKRAKAPEYYSVADLTRLANEARKPNEEVAAWLERRDAEWARLNARPPPPAETPVVSNGVKAAPASLSAGREGEPASSSSAAHSRPEPVKTSSFPSTSLADRFAALKANGLKGVDSNCPSSQRTEPPPPPQFPLSPKRSITPSLPTSAPTNHLNLRQPPMSPTARKGDLVADDGAERSGSAPPTLPYSDVQEAATVWDSGATQFRRDGGTPILNQENGVLDRGPAGGVSLASEGRGPHSELADVPSPSKFASAFPSVDELERSLPSNPTSSSSASSHSFLPSLPSVPRSDTSSTAPRAVRPPPPQPPKPDHLSSAAFERDQRSRADAMAKLAAGYSAPPSQPSTSAPSYTNGLPAALIPGGGNKPLPSISSPSSSPSFSPVALPPPSGSAKTFSLPFSTEVRPSHLFQYLQTARAQKGDGPRVLLLDVRSRDEYERARIKGETVCLEPVMLRDGIRSREIEDGLSLAPRHESVSFASRNFYDMIVVYDRSSTSFPTAPPSSTSSDAQRVLWNLWTAIYEREFTKHLERQPVLLTGGWEAWEKQVGPEGSVGSAVSPAGSARPRPQRQNSDQKQSHRKATILPSVDEGGGSVLTNGSSRHGYSTSADPPRVQGAFHHTSSSNYGSTAPSISNPNVLSPRLAMPPTAAQRPGTAPAYDPFHAPPPPLNSRPSYTQPQLDGFSSPSASPAIPRTRSDAVDLHSSLGASSSTYSNGDYTRASFDYSRPSVDYARPTIDYPQLQQRAPASAPAPPPHRPAPPPPASRMPARPPPVKPAPVRSNSSFSSLQFSQYPSDKSHFPTNFAFQEGLIGMSGLKNLGNTCYMNSTIQCLSAAIPFARYFKNGQYRKDINTVNPLGTKGHLANAVAELIRMLWAQQYDFISPVTFREQICRVASQFRGSEQHDAQEFLGFLLDGLHEDCNYVVKKPPPVEMTPEREHDLETLPQQIMSEREWQIYRMRNDSFIVQCFQGQFRNQLTCLTCRKTSTTFNTFMPLSVHIPGGRGTKQVDLRACLQHFVRDEVLDKDEAWNCPRCKKKRQAVKRLSLSKLPPILVIHLKRFSFDGPFSDKIETTVQYPLSGLDLTSFIPPPLMDQRSGKAVGGSPPNGFVYDLFGVTNHYGNLSSGHYTAFVRSGRDWHNIGDSKVSPIEPRVVESAKSAYILYYAMRQ